MCCAHTQKIKMEEPSWFSQTLSSHSRTNWVHAASPSFHHGKKREKVFNVLIHNLQERFLPIFNSPKALLVWHMGQSKRRPEFQTLKGVYDCWGRARFQSSLVINLGTSTESTQLNQAVQLFVTMPTHGQRSEPQRCLPQAGSRDRSRRLREAR